MEKTVKVVRKSPETIQTELLTRVGMLETTMETHRRQTQQATLNHLSLVKEVKGLILRTEKMEQDLLSLAKTVEIVTKDLTETLERADKELSNQELALNKLTVKMLVIEKRYLMVVDLDLDTQIRENNRLRQELRDPAPTDNSDTGS